MRYGVHDRTPVWGPDSGLNGRGWNTAFLASTANVVHELFIYNHKNDEERSRWEARGPGESAGLNVPGTILYSCRGASSSTSPFTNVGLQHRQHHYSGPPFGQEVSQIPQPSHPGVVSELKTPAQTSPDMPPPQKR